MPDTSTPSLPSPGTATAGAAMDRRIGRGRGAWLRRRLWPVSIVLAVVTAAGAAVELVPQSGTLAVSAEEITTATAQSAPFQDYLPVRAAVAPLRTVYVGAVEGGQVERVVALDGASVRTGDVLATLSNPQLQLDVTSREAQIAGQLGGVSAQRLALQQDQATQDNAVAETSYNLLKAQRELAIRESLHAQGFESDAGVKSFQDEVRYYTTRLATLRTARAQGKVIVARQQDEIDRTAAGLRRNLAVVDRSLDALTLRAPLAGRLTNFLLQPGQTLKQGDQIGQIDSEDSYRLDADIDEFYLARVMQGQRATAAFDGRVSALHVSRVKPQVSNGQFRAELVFDGPPPPGLRRGESADVRLTLGRTSEALVLPNGPWLEGSGGSFAYVFDDGKGTAIRRAMTTGRRNPEQVDVTSGLRPGERVVTSSYARFQAFSRLLVHQGMRP